MSQTKQQEQGKAPGTTRARKDWELFWRIIAGLMLLIIGWTAWVLYQITPRSVATPLAYAVQVKSPGAPAAPSAQVSPQPPAAKEGAAALPEPAPAPEAAAVAMAMDQAQAGVRSGAHQSSADVQAAAAEISDEELRQERRRERLKLSTEISTPPVERNTLPQKQQVNPESGPPVPAASNAAGKIRP